MARTLERTEALTERPTAGNHKWWVLVAMVFGLFMPVLDNLVVNVALPTIREDLGTGISGLQWIINAYALTFASFMLTGGALGDLYGRRRFFLVGLITFTASSLFCALSGSTGQLVAFRALQGLGSAMLLPGSLSIISATFTGKERGAAIGIWTAVSGLAVAIGPVVGGFLVERVSWQSIFYINVPIGILGLALTLAVVRESRDRSGSRRLDPPGLITGTAGLFFLVFALIEGKSRGWTDEVILGSLALSAVLLALFVFAESRRESPMLPLSFFRIPTFAAANVVAATVFFAMFGTFFFLALYLQNVQGYSPVQAGMRLFAFSVMMLLVAPTAGRLSDRFGSRWFMTVGPLIAAAGMALLLRTEPGSSYLTVILPAFIIQAAGTAMTMTPMTAAALGSVDPRHVGIASAAVNTSRQLGGVMGIAVLGAIVTSAFSRGLIARLVEGGMANPDAATLVARVGARAASGSLPGSPFEPLVQAAFVHAIHVGMLVAIGFMVVASAVSFLFVRSHVETVAREEAVLYGH